MLRLGRSNSNFYKLLPLFGSIWTLNFRVHVEQDFAGVGLNLSGLQVERKPRSDLWHEGHGRVHDIILDGAWIHCLSTTQASTVVETSGEMIQSLLHSVIMC